MKNGAAKYRNGYDMVWRDPDQECNEVLCFSRRRSIRSTTAEHAIKV